MNILVACDSFKDALPADGVCRAIAAGLARSYPGAIITQMPLSDGGEGLLDGAAFAGEEGFGLVDEGGVVGLADALDAGGGAAADLMEQAGAVAGVENGVGAGARKPSLAPPWEQRPTPR